MKRTLFVMTLLFFLPTQTNGSGDGFYEPWHDHPRIGHCPQLRPWIGLTVSKRAKDALKNDPFVLHHKPWQGALEQLIAMGVRAEQQGKVNDL